MRKTNRYSVNKTSSLLQTIGGNGEPNFFYAEIVTDITTLSMTKLNMTTQRKLVSLISLHVIKVDSCVLNVEEQD